MTISFQATRDDLAEPVIRKFLRGRTARQNRTRSSLWGALIMAAAFLFIFRAHPPEFLALAAVIGAAAGAAVNFWTYAPGVRKRVRRSIQTELGDKLPIDTTFLIKPGWLACEYLGTRIEFSLQDLQGVSEDAERMELSFGDKGLGTIPLRAFRDEAEKSAFKKALEANKAASPGVSGPTAP